MNKCFPGRTERVFFDKLNDYLQVDIHILEAPTKQDFHVLYTVGMSALPMKLPDEFYPDYQMLERAELIALLPAEWQLPEPAEGETYNNMKSSEVVSAPSIKVRWKRHAAWVCPTA